MELKAPPRISVKKPQGRRRSAEDFFEYGRRLSGRWFIQACSRKPLPQPSLIVSAAYKPAGDMELFCIAAMFAGCAVVWNTQDRNTVVIGTAVNVKGLLGLYPTVGDKRQYIETDKGLSYMRQGIIMNSPYSPMTPEQARCFYQTDPDPPALLKRYLDAYDRWLRLNPVQHRICELFPQFRVHDTNYNVEVELKPQHMEMRLAGCVWKPRAHIDKSGRKYLGFND